MGRRLFFSSKGGVERKSAAGVCQGDFSLWVGPSVIVFIYFVLFYFYFSFSCVWSLYMGSHPAFCVSCQSVVRRCDAFSYICVPALSDWQISCAEWWCADFKSVLAERSWRAHMEQNIDHFQTLSCSFISCCFTAKLGSVWTPTFRTTPPYG